MKFSKAFLINKNETDDYVATGFTSKSRWSLNYFGIFSYEGKFYRTTWQQGATEYQDTSPYEYDDSEIYCPEVVAVQKTITVYEPIQSDGGSEHG